MNNNTCVCCGAIIPEGRQVCPKCESGTYNPDDFFSAERKKEKLPTRIDEILARISHDVGWFVDRTGLNSAEIIITQNLYWEIVQRDVTLTHFDINGNHTLFGCRIRFLEGSGSEWYVGLRGSVLQKTEDE